MQPGSIVVCINDRDFIPDVRQYVSAVPEEGRVYTVRELIPDTNDPKAEPGVTLEEIHGKTIRSKNYKGEWQLVEFHFYIWRFAELLPPDAAEAFIESELMKEELTNNTE